MGTTKKTSKARKAIVVKDLSAKDAKTVKGGLDAGGHAERRDPYKS